MAETPAPADITVGSHRFRAGTFATEAGGIVLPCLAHHAQGPCPVGWDPTGDRFVVAAPSPTPLVERLRAVAARAWEAGDSWDDGLDHTLRSLGDAIDGLADELAAEPPALDPPLEIVRDGHGLSQRAASPVIPDLRYLRQHGGCLEAADDNSASGGEPDILHFCTLAEARRFLAEFGAFVDAAEAAGPGRADT